MKTIHNRIISVVLVLCLCVSLFPVMAMEAEAASITLSASTVRDYVLSLVGSSYESGFCMRFVADCFEQLGATRSSSCCAYNYGNTYIQSTDSSNIPIGADVFFGNTGGTPNHSCNSPVNGHIGIYVGDGYFVHVPSSGKVEKTSLSNSYWGSRFRGWGYHGNVTITSNIPADACTCSETYAGWYQVTDPDSLNIRDGHSQSANKLGEMPGGEVVYISKATGTGKGNWGHVTYNGISGYCAMGLLAPFAGVDVGTDFCAPIFNLEHWKIIENSNGVVQTADEMGSANQLWWFERQSDGSYFIRSCVDGTFLDVYGAYTDMGTTVQTCGETGSPAQRWFIYEDGGGYILRTALNNYVLDLPDNDPTNGNSLHIWEKNGTGAQVWAIYRGEECQLTAPTLSVNVGNSASATQFTWNDAYGERQFNLRIWKDVLWEGEPYHDAWDVDVASVTEVLLPAGTYHAYIDAEHYFDVKPSNVVTFTVQDPQEYTLRYDANGGTAAPSEQIKYSLVPLTLSSQIPAGKSYTVSFEPNGGMLEAYSKEVSQSFVSWNTSSDGSGISYAPEAVYSEDAPATLYAQWENATLGSVEDLRRDGYYFLGWYDSDVVDSEGEPIGHEYTFSSVINGDVTLYAMWTPADTLYFGDVDLSGTVEFTDLVAIRLYMADKYTPECDAEEFLLRADLNRDGQISDADTEIIRSVLVAEITVEELHASYEKASISTDVRTNYQYGEELDTLELTMQIYFSEGMSYSVINGLQVHGYDPYRIGKQTLTVSFYQFEAVYEVQVECTHENKQCIPATSANCTDSGNNQYYICNICNEVLKADGKTKTTVDDEIIAATGHSYTENVTAPTCTEKGYTTHTCACGDSFVDSYVSAKGHAMGEWYETKAPTCTDQGTEQRDCADCDHYETRETEAEGHSYTDVVTAPTCTEKGYTTHTCACGDSYKDAYTDQLGHTYSNGSCTHCGATDPNYVIDQNAPQIAVETVKSIAGKTVTIDVELKNNPGVAYLLLTLDYDKSALTLVSVENGELISDMDEGVNLAWSSNEDCTSDGVLCKLTFQISKDAQAGQYLVRAIFREAYDCNDGTIKFSVVDGAIEVAAFVYGDANGDGTVNGRDVLLLRKFMANYDFDTGTSNVEVSAGADANGDGVVNGRDVLLLRKYMANYDFDTGLSSVVLGPQG